MESKIDEVLDNLRRMISTIADSEQAVNELKHIMFDPTISEGEIALCLYYVFNSSKSILKFFDEYANKKDRIIASMRKKLYEVLTEYIQIKYQKIYGYLDNIVSTCLRSFSADCSSLVKEAAIHPLIQIMSLYDPNRIRDVIEPKRLMNIMLDEIKLKRPGATLKSTIWEIVGWIHKLYPEDSQEFRLETQDVMMNSLLEQLDGDKFEIKHIWGLLRGFTLGLHDCVLEADQIEKLFQITKGLIKPHKEINSIRMWVEAMTLLSTHAELFKADLKKASHDIITTALDIGAKQSNQDIREAAGELLAQVAIQVADCDEEDEESKQITRDIIDMMTKVWNDESEHSVKIEPTVKAVGILSKGIKNLMGEDTLKVYLDKLMFVEMNTYRIVEEFGDLSDPDREVKKFKVILKKQKQLISFLSSYASFVSNMDSPPGERECQHFYDLALTATRNFRKLYVKWRPKFLEALASLIMALHKHQAIFIHWIVRFVKQAVGDIITIHGGVLRAELEESLDDGVLFWQGLIEATKELSEPTWVQIYDTLLNTVISYISSVVTDIWPTFINDVDTDMVTSSTMQYDKDSNIFLSRLSDFCLLLLPNCQSEWFVRWYPNYVQLLHRLMSTHKNPNLYPLMAVPLLTCDVKDILNEAQKPTYEVVYKWIIKSAVPRLNDYRQGLLQIGSEERNKHILLDFIEKVEHIILHGGASSEPSKFGMTKTSVREADLARKEIFNFLFSFLVSRKDSPSAKSEEEKEEIPLGVEIRKGRTIALKKLQAAKQSREAKNNDKEEIEVRVLGLLGRLGGISHQIVKTDGDKDKREDTEVDFVGILTSKTSGLQFNVTMEGFGVQIQLKTILSKIIEFAEQSSDSETKNTACDLLESLKENIRELIPEKEDSDVEMEDSELPPFKSLCIQFVRWFAQTIPFDSNDTRNMLSALQEIAFSKSKHMNLELASKCIWEYTQTLLKVQQVSKSNKYIKAILRNLQSDSSHPNPSRRYVWIYNFKQLLNIIKDARFTLFEFAMTEIAPVCFKNVSQLIVATSHKVYYEKDIQTDAKPAVELYLLSRLIVDNIEAFAIKVKEEGERTEQNEQVDSKVNSITAFEEFAEFLLQNSFSSDHHCRYESQKVLHAIASKFFAIVSQMSQEDLPNWILDLINKCNLVVNKKIDDSQLEILNNTTDEFINDQSNIINHLTAQLQGINWLVSDMKVKLEQLVNDDLLFNVMQGVNKLDIVADKQTPLASLKPQYLKQLFILLKHCSHSEDFHAKFVLELESQTNFDSYAAAIQTLLIPHSLGLEFSSEEESSLDEIMLSAKEYLLVQSVKREKRLLRGIKVVREKHEYVDLTCLDPEIPEEYSAKVILQLTQGYVTLVEIEKETDKKDIWELLSNKWNAHLVGCTELWVGNDSSPVINLKGKILLNFLCQVYIPNEKVCSWLTDKSSEFQKGIDSLCTYIASNPQIIEYLVARTPDHPILLSLWVPIINTLIQGIQDPTEILKYFVRYIPREWKEPLDDDDRKADQLRTYSVISHYCKKMNLFDEGVFPEATELLTHFLNQITEYSHERHPVFVKYECMNLVGIIYNLKSPSKNKRNGANHQIIGEFLCNSLFRIMNQYFPLWSHEIRPDTREKRYYEMIFDGILNLITFSKNPHALKLLYRVIKEDKTLCEYKLEHALHVLITKGINTLSLAEFLVQTKIVFAEFIDFDNEGQGIGNQSIHNNLKFGIVERCLLKIFKTCPFEYLTPLINELAPKLMKRLQADFDVNDIDHVMFQLKERGYILRIIEGWTNRIDQSHANVKDFYNSIRVNGIELTKALIKVCHYGKFVDIPKLADGKIHKEADLKDWNELVNFYIWGCWSCICSVITATQTKESLFENFLFTSKEGQEPIFNLVVPHCIKYQFSVETDFKVKDNFHEKQWENSKEDDIIKRFNDNFFSNDNILMSVPLESKVEENPKLLKRRQDKVRQLLDEDEEGEEEETPVTTPEEDDFELDEINSHPWMQSILKVLDSIYTQFSKEWKEDQMPNWMQKLYDDFPRLNPSAKLFVFKLIINRPEVFHNYANYWFDYLADYATSKDTGGKGLHYFLRDVCSILIGFSDKIDVTTDKNKKYCNDILNWLIKYAADKRRLIFTYNIGVISGLMEKWRPAIDSMNEEMLSKMLNAKEEQIQNSDLWRMTAIQIVALACKLGIKSQLLNDLLKQLEHRKRSIIYSASEVIGVLLSNQPDLLDEASTKIQALFSGEAKQDLFVNIAQKISKYQGLFVLQKPILQKLLAFLKPFSASFRACILQSFRSAVVQCLIDKNSKVIQEICMCLQAHHEDIIADKDDECQQSFILLLKELVKSDERARDNLFKVLMDFNSNPNIHSIMSSNRNHLTRGLYCDLMVALYNESSQFKEIATVALIKNIEDPNELIKNKLLIFWSDPNRLSTNPTQRLLKMLQNKGMFENERIWLQASVWLLLDLVRYSKNSDTNSALDISSGKIPSSGDKIQDESMEVDGSQSQPKEESKSQGRRIYKAKDLKSSQNDETPFESSFNQASFGQTLEWSSGFHKDSKFYKSYQKETFLMSMGTNDAHLSQGRNASNLEKVDEKNKFNFGLAKEHSQTMNFDKVEPSRNLVLNPATQFVTNARKKKKPLGFSKFFEKNEIKTPMTILGKGKVRFQPDGMYRITHNKLKQRKLQHGKLLEKQRKAARVKLLMKNRDFENKENEPENISLQTQDMLYPLQTLVLLDTDVHKERYPTEIAGALFYNLFDWLFDGEPSQDVKDELASEVIKILNDSVACDSATMSSLLLILLKLCKTYRTIDLKAVERVGIKSLNFSKAILLLEELIICREDNKEGDRVRGTDYNSGLDKNKEWIWLKRLHEASDSTGSQNLMLDEFLLLDKDKNGEFELVRGSNLGDTSSQIEKKKLAKMYLDQLEQSNNFDELWEEIAEEVKHNYYKCKSELLEWESI